MWALYVFWMLLGTLGAGSAQLTFQKVGSVKMDPCNNTEIVIPCFVTNLNKSNVKEMYVKWKLQGKDFFIFDGFDNKYHVNDTFKSAHFSNIENLTSGVASLKLSLKEAISGNYTCLVVEGNREGETVIELIESSVVWFEQVEAVFVIATAIMAAVFFLLQVGFVAVKFDMSLHKKIGFGALGLIFTIIAVIGAVLFIAEGFTASNQAGFALVVLPAVILVPPLYFLFQSVFEKPPLFALILVALKTLGYLIALAGFAACVSACPPTRGSIVIAGLAMMDIVAAIAFVYIIVIGTSFKDHQPPRHLW